MKKTAGFSEILENVIESQTDSTMTWNSFSAPSDFSAGWESALDPAGLTQIIASTSIYIRPTRSYPSPPKKVRVRPSHVMNDEQKQAFELLAGFAVELKDNFTSANLKSAYRLSLLKSHPDQGGSSEYFWAVKKSYELLKTLVTS